MKQNGAIKKDPVVLQELNKHPETAGGRCILTEGSDPRPHGGFPLVSENATKGSGFVRNGAKGEFSPEQKGTGN